MQIDNQNADVSQHILIVVFGPPASGKTTFAEALRASYHQLHHSSESCLILSADCLEEYLRNHSLKMLSELIDQPMQFEKLNQYKLDRSCFIQANWKESRMFIKNNLKTILTKWKVVILQDDLLLKSQRKQMRQIAEALKLKYMQILISSSLEECLNNWKKRELSEDKSSVESIAKQWYEKLEIDDHPYLITVQQSYVKKQNLWASIQAQVKQVVILHPELIESQKREQNQQSRAKDRVQVEIRKYISEIMRNKEWQLKLFGQISSNKVSALLSSIKKRYNEKTKSLQGFIDFLSSETAKFTEFDSKNYA